jgi:hypothetical protein
MQRSDLATLLQPFIATRQWLQGWLQDEQFQVCMKKLKAGARGPFHEAAPLEATMDPGSSPG